MTGVIAAVFVLAHWLSPERGSAPLLRYEMRRCNATAGCAPATMWRTPGGATTQTPKPAGEAESCWVSVSTTPTSTYGWANGGAAYQVRVIATDGDSSDWSNVAATAAGCPDTLFTDSRTWAYPVDGVVCFTRSPADSSLDVYGLPGPIARSREALEALRPRMCAIFGYHVEAGARRSCP